MGDILSFYMIRVTIRECGGLLFRELDNLIIFSLNWLAISCADHFGLQFSF
jgi:hypothetical protein